MNDIAEIISELQDLELDPKELTELVTALTTDGLTEPLRRKVRAVLLKSLNKEVADIERYERVLDVVKERDEIVEAAGKKAEQALNRSAMESKAKLDTLQRKVGEDVDAAKGGATLLLHTEDVASQEDTKLSGLPVQAIKPTPAAIESPKMPVEPELSPKQAAMAAMQPAPQPAVPISPTTNPIAPSSPSLPSYTSNLPLPATMAPLPKTSIMPPAVTEPTAA